MIDTGSGKVTYGTVRRAMDGQPYTMSLTGQDEIRAVIQAVNQGIDGHLEACFCPALGDRYEGGQRKAGKLVLCRTLECSVSPESLPVLLRRLFELNGDEEMMEVASSLASVTSTVPASSSSIVIPNLSLTYPSKSSQECW